MRERPLAAGEPNLTAHELEVLQRVAEGLQNKQIAQQLGLAVNTVENMLCNNKSDRRAIYPKIGVSNRAGAAAWYRERYGKDDQLNLIIVPKIAQQAEKILRDEAPTHSRGMYLMLLGSILRDTYHCDEAIAYFREAECIFGIVSSQAARAACKIAQMYLELGDLAKARAELVRALQLYEPVMDIDTSVELNRTWGWLNYTEGDFLQSERWLQQCLHIADEAGTEGLGRHAHHFLGKLYYNMGRAASQQHVADARFYKAEAHLEQAYQLDSVWGREANQAFDLLRKAQLFHLQHKWRDARKLRTRARHLFGANLTALHVDLEEAKVAITDKSETRATIRKVEDALRAWADVKKADGMAMALHILGTSKYFQGKPDQALELFVAALCIYPPKSFLDNQQVWDCIQNIINQGVSDGYQQWVLRIKQLVENRQGYFSYLNSITADRSTDIAAILDRLSSL